MDQKRRSQVTLAGKYNAKKAFAKNNVMLLSEKLDGMRAYFDLEDGVLKSRTGKSISCPKEWLEDLKRVNLSLDGELYAGRGKFQEVASICRKTKNMSDKEWENIQFHVFDIRLDEVMFQNRLKKLKTTNLPPFITVVDQVSVTSDDDVKKHLVDVEALGGEGVMVKDPCSFYEYKRSNSTMKVKSFLDMEAVVTGILKGKGKYSNMMGKLECTTLSSSTSFRVGSGFTDDQRKIDHFKIGDIITVRYFELTNRNVPRHPSFAGMRPIIDLPSHDSPTTPTKRPRDPDTPSSTKKNKIN